MPTPGASPSHSYSCGVQTCGLQNARRVRSRSSVPVGTNGDRAVASLARHSRSTLRNGYRMKAGDDPVFPSPVRVVRVGARLSGDVCPEVAGLRRILIDTDAVPAVIGQALRALAPEVLAEHARG